MKLQHVMTKRQLKVGDRPVVTAECAMKGQVIEVQRIHPPNSHFHEGRIIYGIDKIYFRHLLPSVLGYEWVEDVSQA